MNKMLHLPSRSISNRIFVERFKHMNSLNKINGMGVPLLEKAECRKSVRERERENKEFFYQASFHYNCVRFKCYLCHTFFLISL